MTALAITSLSKSYRAGAPGCSASVSVLRDLDLALWPGEVVALEGGAGCGKSTMLRCAAGLLPPDSGAICWFGARAVRRETVAYVSAAETPASPSRYALLRDGPRDRDKSGALYAAVARALTPRVRLLLVDDLPCVSALERRLVYARLRDYSLAGAAVLFTASEKLSSAPFVSRAVTLADGHLTQRRKFSDTDVAASSRASSSESNDQYLSRD